MARLHLTRLGAVAWLTVHAIWPISAAAQTHVPAENLTPTDVLTLVTVNAEQNESSRDPTRIGELARALRERPVAEDGNYYAPDLLVLNETTPDAAIEIRDSLNREFMKTGASSRFELLGSLDPQVRARFLLNTTTMDGSGTSSVTWQDTCLAGRKYQYLEGVRETEGTTFTLAGIHFSKDYPDPHCQPRNIQELNSRVSGKQGPIFLAGDFNRRSAKEQLECDPNEMSGPLPWYRSLVSGGNPPYTDAVRDFNRERGTDFLDEWTHEWANPSLLCDGAEGLRRNRIDYIFSSVPGTSDPVVEAHADHAAQRDDYADHRFVWGLLNLAS